MVDEGRNWAGSPEERIIREAFYTKEGGVTPGDSSTQYGMVLETLLIRELQTLARVRSNRDLRFSRGYIVEDYGQSESGKISIKESPQVTADGPRFDIVCYSGEVAWSSFDGLPVAIIPKSYAVGVIEVKRTLSPGYFPPDSSRAMNSQFSDQRQYLSDLGLSIPFIVIGAHFRGTPTENRQKAFADHVAFLGDLAEKGLAQQMARTGELQQVVEFLEAGEVPLDEEAKAKKQKVEGLQDIARGLKSSSTDDIDS